MLLIKRQSMRADRHRYLGVAIPANAGGLLTKPSGSVLLLREPRGDWFAYAMVNNILTSRGAAFSRR